MYTPRKDVSDFYHACLMNDISRVKSYLGQMTVDEINRIESNGSTALHAAAFHNNIGVVYLLIRHGAIGSIKNRFNLTPYEETTSAYIKELLSNTGNEAWIEWTLVDPPTRETKHIFDSTLKNTFRNMGLPFILDYLLNHYVRRYVAEALPMSMEEIERYFVDARTSNTLFPLIVAYTTTLGFDKLINQHCIQVLPDLLRVVANPQNTLAASIFYVIASLNFDPMLRPRYAFTGCVYRGLTASADYIRTFKKNELIVNRPWVSTSRNMKVANAFAGLGESAQYRRAESNKFLQASVRLTYQIRRPETRAIDITDISIFSTEEEEVLLMPISVFRVVDITSNANGSQFDILLEDCELPSRSDPAAPIIRCDFVEFSNISLLVPIVQPLTKKSNTSDWTHRLTTAIQNLSTRGVIITFIAITIAIVLILLAIILPIIVRSSRKNNMETRTLAE